MKPVRVSDELLQADADLYDSLRSAFEEAGARPACPDCATSEQMCAACQAEEARGLSR